MLKKRLVVSFFFVIFLSSSSNILAHPGNTASDGCHYCRTNCDEWGVPWNQRHCHGGYVAPEPKIIVPTIPSETKGGPTYFINKSGVVEMLFDWDRPDGKQYSIVMSKTAGGDPGPNTDTTKSEYTFTNIKPGKWYINVKEEFNGYWSEVSYWTIDVPNNVKDIAGPYPTPTPIPTKSNTYKESTNNEDSPNGLGTIAMAGLGAGIYHFFNKVKK